MTNSIKPFLKWPGGKRWLIEKIIQSISVSNCTYYEPFLGGGSFFFAIQPERAVLSDINAELIELFSIMRDRPDELKSKMIYHNNHHSAEYYYKIRKMQPRTSLTRAARLLYLNRTCFNGMYRVNKQGHFNVPLGSKNNCIYDIEDFQLYSKILKKSALYCADFEQTINLAKKDDLIFADPPYAVNDREIFTKYNDTLFSWNDQERLFESLSKSKSRGVNIVTTNAYFEDIKTMYLQDGFYGYVVDRISSIAGNPCKRKKVRELVFSTMEISSLRSVE